MEEEASCSSSNQPPPGRERNQKCLICMKPASDCDVYLRGGDLNAERDNPEQYLGKGVLATDVLSCLGFEYPLSETLSSLNIEMRFCATHSASMHILLFKLPEIRKLEVIKKTLRDDFSNSYAENGNGPVGQRNQPEIIRRMANAAIVPETVKKEPDPRENGRDQVEEGRGSRENARDVEEGLGFRENGDQQHVVEMDSSSSNLESTFNNMQNRNAEHGSTRNVEGQQRVNINQAEETLETENQDSASTSPNTARLPRRSNPKRVKSDNSDRNKHLGPSPKERASDADNSCVHCQHLHQLRRRSTICAQCGRPGHCRGWLLHHQLRCRNKAKKF